MSPSDVMVWILAVACAGVFFLVYGVVEEIIRKRPTPRKMAKPALPFATSPIIEPLPKADTASAIRGYDAPESFRRDALIHIRHLESEVAKHERNIQAILTEMKKRERPIDCLDGHLRLALRNYNSEISLTLRTCAG